MRYFNNALEDRRVFRITDSGISPYVGPYTTPPTELPNSLTVGTTTAPVILPNNLGLDDRFTPLGDTTLWDTTLRDTTLLAWTNIGATPEMQEHINKFGETPTYVGSDGKVHVDRKALIQRVVDYYAGPEGGSMNLDGFSAERFANAGPDERMAMLRDMREQNDAAKAAKFEEDMRLAQERDAAKEAQNNQAGPAGGNTTGQIIATVGQVIGMLV